MATKNMIVHKYLSPYNGKRCTAHTFHDCCQDARMILASCERDCHQKAQKFCPYDVEIKPIKENGSVQFFGRSNELLAKIEFAGSELDAAQTMLIDDFAQELCYETVLDANRSPNLRLVDVERVDNVFIVSSPPEIAKEGNPTIKITIGQGHFSPDLGISFEVEHVLSKYALNVRAPG